MLLHIHTQPSPCASIENELEVSTVWISLDKILHIGNRYHFLTLHIDKLIQKIFQSCNNTILNQSKNMTTSSKRNIFRVTGPLCGEFTSHRWIPLTTASDAELWCFLWSAPWINDWVNNRDVGDLRRHHAHYDVIVMNDDACYQLTMRSTSIFCDSSSNNTSSTPEKLHLTILIFQPGGNNFMCTATITAPIYEVQWLRKQFHISERTIMLVPHRRKSMPSWWGAYITTHHQCQLTNSVIS